MGYRDDFFVVNNICGYTGQLGEKCTVYFRSDTERGRITQDHHNADNIGRDFVKDSRGYSIENFEDDDGEEKAMEFEWDWRVHKSRHPFVDVDITTAAEGDRAILAQSIW